MTRAGRTGSPLPERLLAVLCGLVAVGAWAQLEAHPGRIGGPAVAFGCAFAASTLVGALLRYLLQPGGLSVHTERLARTSRHDPLPVQLRALSAPGRTIWLLPVLVTPLMAISTPIAYHFSPGDHSIWAVLAAFVIFGGWGGQLAGFLVWLMVRLPIMLLAGVLGRMAGRGRIGTSELFVLTIGVMLLAMVGAGVCVTIGTSGGSVAALVWLGTAIVDHPAVLWIGRGCLVLIIAAIAVLSELGRQLAADRRSTR